MSQGSTMLAEITLQDRTYTTGKFGFYNFSQGPIVYTGFRRQITPSYAYAVEAVDADGDALTYKLVDGPAGMVFKPNTNTLTWTPVASGSHQVVLQVDDSLGGSSQQAFTLSVRPPGASIQGTVYDDTNGNGQRDDVIAPTGTVNVNVPGTANPYLAGMPNGSMAQEGDVAPAQSPTPVIGLPALSSGSFLTFATQGSVSFGGGTTTGPDGGLTFLVDHRNGAENGISDVRMPVNALLGVFLGPGTPTTTAAPSSLNFDTGGNVPGGIEFATLWWHHQFLDTATRRRSSR